jgi:hypothetical protein
MHYEITGVAEILNRTAFIILGNSDNKLTQEQWADACTDLANLPRNISEDWEIDIQVQGVWYSLPNSPFQNMCICFSVSILRVDEKLFMKFLRSWIRSLAAYTNQDSVAFSYDDCVEFLGPILDRDDEDNEDDE